MVNNIGTPTQEDFSLRLNLSSIDTVEEKKEHIIQRDLTGLLSHPLGGLSLQNRNSISSGVKVG